MHTLNKSIVHILSAQKQPSYKIYVISALNEEGGKSKIWTEK